MVKKYSREHWMMLVTPFTNHWRKIRPSRERVLQMAGLFVGLLVFRAVIHPSSGMIEVMKSMGLR